MERAFTRLDLGCLVVVLAMLAGLAGLNFTGERGREMQCARNLKKLGQVMQEYAGEHGGGLPPAYSQQPSASWDTLLTPYLRPDLAATRSAYAKRLLKSSVAPSFLCPSDNLVRAHPRTYLMSRHDMQPENWPPGPDNATGIGLAWDAQHVKTLLGDDAWNQARTNRNTLALVKLSWLPDPANTLLLTELVRPDNQLGTLTTVTVGSARQQVDWFKGDRALFHHGRFNYLMADGHVELLSPFQIGNAGADDADRPGDIWTIKAGD
jgi:prepilin-type processing-associated H-X9-DG protein